MPTTTLLAACNEVLLNIGEAEVTDLTSPVGKKVRLAMQNAIRTVSMMHNWTYLQTVVQTTNWTNGYAQLVPFQEVYNVSLRNDVLSSAPIDQLYELLIKNPQVGSTPLYFAITGNNQVLVYPEPPAGDKNLVLFRVLLRPTVPSLASDSFTVPDDIYDLIGVYAQMLMHRNHTTDLQSMQACSAEFELRTHILRSRDQSQTTANMG